MAPKKAGLGRIERALTPVGKASVHAIAAPPPRDGEVRRTALPDTFDGIRFEIGRMIEYVRDAATDPVVAANAHAACAGAETPSECLKAIDAWCRAHFAYVNDPPNVEVLQTPRRMIKQTRVPPEVLKSIMVPFYDAMASAIDPAQVEEYVPPPLTTGDCDEGASLFLSNCACVPEIGPLRFRFGGHDDTLHHVWDSVGCEGTFHDSDLTEPDYTLGDFSKFAHYEEVEVPLP